jgi:hypothetical protein
LEAVRYELLSILGEGGFGRVYRARAQGLDGFEKYVAVKVLTDPDPPEEILQRFRDEARLLGLVRDRAVVAVDAPIRIEGRWAVVMELADGVSCRELLRQGLFPASVACEIVGEVARALHVLHQHTGPDGAPLGLVHRDIKPDNIQVSPSGSVKVLDFGIAKATFRSREAVTGHLIGGTVGYMAPERLEGEEGPQADIYSLGVVLHELVTGRRPSLTEPRSETTFVRGGSSDQDDPGPLLELASRMRSLEPHLRPLAREVERECRTLRGRLQGPWLSDWAERHVPATPQREADDPLLRRVLTAELTPAPTLAPPTREPPADTRWGRLALAAGAALGLSGSGLVALAALLGLVVLAWSRWPAEEPVPVQVVPEVAPGVAPEIALVVLPEEPEPPVLEPEPPRLPAVELLPLPLVRPPPAPAPVPVAQPPEVVPPEVVPPEAAPAPAVPTWQVVLLSDPAGASVTLKDRGPVGRTPLPLELPAGVYELQMSHGDRQGSTTIRVGMRMPRTHAWTAAEDRWSSSY